jgi:release factor glutamine methyltransferase
VAVALKVNRPDLIITATDISVAALKVARQNAKRHQVEIGFIQSNMFSRVDGRFNLVLANLPYVPNSVRRQPELDFEPQVALYAGADGLDYYRLFFEHISFHLAADGQAIIEAGPTQRAKLKILAAQAGLKLTSQSEYVSILKP